MKNKIIYLGIFIATYTFNLTYAMSQSTSGFSVAPAANQPSSTAPLDYVGWDNTTFFPLEIRTNATGANAQPINFYTVNLQRMTILGTTNPGFVGIATTAPPFLLSLGTAGSSPDGGILALGTRSSGATLPSSLTDTRMIWYPKKGAFRAGLASTEWDDANIGEFSAAFGWYTTASGQASIASGQSSTSSGQNSVALGGSTTAAGNCSVALGHLSEANFFASAAIGWHAISNEARGMAIGSYVRVPANSYESIVLGSGDLTNIPCYLDNTIPQSLMIGFNSDVPTLFVGPAPAASGACGASHFTGNVGVATTSPNRKLEIFDGANPQLRLSRTIPSTLIYSDLQTTSLGDLYVHPYDGAADR